MSEASWLAEQFEQVRPHLRSVAYGMLGSLSEADDAVQECWLRLSRSDSEGIRDLQGWLTTVVARICLDLLRSRRARREEYQGDRLPEPLVTEPAEQGPEHQAVLADSIGLALLIVLDTLSPPERLAFVLHDVFAVPYDEIAEITDRTPDAARQLASRARRRVQSAPQPDGDVARQRQVVDAFLRAARTGDFAALLAVLDPDVVLRFDLGTSTGRPSLMGAHAVATHVLRTAPRYLSLAKPVHINGSAGLLFGAPEEPVSVLAFTVVAGRIAALDMIADPAKLRHLLRQP